MNAVTDGLSFSRLQLIPQRGHSIMKSHLVASSAEEWNVQELRVACIPCRDGESSDEMSKTPEHISSCT